MRRRFVQLDQVHAVGELARQRLARYRANGLRTEAVRGPDRQQRNEGLLGKVWTGRAR